MLIALLILLALLQVADWYSTRTILAKGGREQNPIARLGMEYFGVDGFLVLKGIFVVLVGAWIGFSSLLMLGLVVVAYAAVIRHNWKSMP